MDTIQFSQTQITQHGIIDRLIKRGITEREAAELLDKSIRQVRRIRRKIFLYGIEALIHGNHGKVPWNKRDEQLTDTIVTIYKTKYLGFNCLHFRDMLAEHENITITRESLRTIFVTHNLSRKKRRPQRRFERRERKPQAGLLIQQDTSIHDWFDTGKRCALIAAIDDATSEVVCAQFFPSDGTLPNMHVMKTITEVFGIPVAFYVDRASHFKTIRHESIHIQLSGIYDETQIARALKEIGITLILALSPQAKGRVERLFETLQDRLIKELKLASVKTREGGNAFLLSWIPTFNKRFMVSPASTVSAYRKLPNHIPLERIFSIQEDRLVKKDNTISFEGKEYLISSSPKRASFAKVTITIHKFITGKIHMYYQGEELAYTSPWTNSLGSEQDIIAGE